MISFSNYIAFLLLFIFPTFIFLQKRKIKKTSFEFSILSWRTTKKIKSKNFLFKLSNLFFFLGIIFIIIGLASPRFTNKKNIFVDNKIEVMFVLDVSPSMAITDMNIEGKKKLARLEVAKETVKTFINKNKNIAVGLTLFGSDSSLIIPLTLNHKIFLERLASVKVGDLGKGTALGNGLATALLHSTRNSNLYFIVLTDGENNSGAVSPLTAVKVIAERKINLYLIGIGAEGEARVKYTDSADSKTYTGISQSSFDEVGLKNLAKSANGFYFFADSYKTLVDSVSFVSNTLEKKIIKKDITESFLLQDYFVILAFVFLVLTFVIKRVILKMVL